MLPAALAEAASTHLDQKIALCFQDEARFGYPAEILCGGPARGEDSLADAMILMLRTGDRSAAEVFAAADPDDAFG